MSIRTMRMVWLEVGVERERQLEGPGLEGLRTAENMLFVAGYPPTDPTITSGSYTDKELRVSVRWKMV